MKIKPFKVEEWMNLYEEEATYNIAETCADSISIKALFELAGKDSAQVLEALISRPLTYGHIVGNPAFLSGICSLYKDINPDNIITTHGAAGANHLLISSLVEPGDQVVSVTPTYQQLYSIPESIGAEVKLLHLKKEDGYLPDIEQLKKLVSSKTKLICINNPNNPTGALMDEDMLRQIADIAKECGAYLLCDEVYRHLTQSGEYIESIADMYEKGISVSSMSKVFSLAGLRLGWIATRDSSVRQKCLSHRDYNTISCGVIDEEIAALALEHSGALIKRNRELIQRNLKILKSWVNSEPRVSFVEPKAGTTALLHYELDMDSTEFCTKLLNQTGAFLTPGDCFDIPKSLRIGYACDTKVLEDGLEKLHEFILSVS